MESGPRLPLFYAGREVLITGATGFMGKVLVERLLTTCPEIRRLHLLVRDKRGLAPHERLHQLKQSQVFDNIRARCPSQLDKVVIVPGDVTEPQLGLDTTAITTLKEVSVVFHNAANVKLQDPLGCAVAQNTLAAIHVMDVCDQLPKLTALVHVSTAFSNMERSHIEERVYEPPTSLPDVLAVLQTHSPEEVDKMTAKLIHPKPSTYAFTKALAEAVVAQRRHRNYPVAIFRPSLVISAHRAPFPGWIDGFSGMTGLVVSLGQGLLRVTVYDSECMADVVPVDVAIDTMIAVAWETATERGAEARVYYCGSAERALLWREVHCALARAGQLYPMDHVLYHPFAFTFRNRHLFKIFELFLQTVPLYVAGYIVDFCGVQLPVSLKTVARYLSTLGRIQGSVGCNEWTFSYDNVRHLREKRTDGQLFYLDIRDINWQEHMANFHLGARRYLLRQKDETLVRAKKRMRRLRLIHYVVLCTVALLGCKLLMLLVSW